MYKKTLDRIIIDPLLTDPRVSNFYACIQCGSCTSVCPAASIDKEYNPRKFVMNLILGRNTDHYPLEECFHCYSCKYTCKRGNSISDIVKVLEEREGLNGKIHQEEPHYKALYERGLCVTVDMLSPDEFPEWGSRWEEIRGGMKKTRSELDLEGLYREIPLDSISEIQKIVDVTEGKEFRRIGDVEEVERKKRIPKSKISLFHSCIGDAHYPGITVSIKWIFDRLGIDYIDDPRHSTCTGFAYYANKIPFSTTLSINARNFALAEEAGYPNIAPVCQTSYGVLTESAEILKNGIGRLVNEEVLSKVNRKFEDTINIVHVSEILWAQRDKIKEKVKHKFDGLKVATHNGCHYTKIFRKSAIPNLLEELVSVMGAEPVDYGEKRLCCGMGFGHTIEQEQRYLSRAIAQRKLLSIKEAGAEVVVVACPGCQITFDRNQEFIERENGVEIDLPIINYAQFLALAMGADPYKIAAIQTHSYSLEPILEKLNLL